MLNGEVEYISFFTVDEHEAPEFRHFVRKQQETVKCDKSCFGISGFFL